MVLRFPVHSSARHSLSKVFNRQPSTTFNALRNHQNKVGSLTPLRFSSTTSQPPKTFTWSRGVAGVTLAGLGYSIYTLSTAADPVNEHSSNSKSPLASTDPRVAFEHKSLPDLLLSLLVYKMCSFPVLMEASPTLLSILETLHISAPAYWLIKKTIFNQFCGGETREEVVPFMQDLKKSGIGSILDFSIEADLSTADASMTAEELSELANKHSDSVSDQYCQAVVTASHLPGSFIAIKVTGLASPSLLEKANAIQHFLRNSFLIADTKQNGHLTRKQFEGIVSKLPGATPELVKKTIAKADPSNKNSIDWIDYQRSLSMLSEDNSALFIGPNAHVEAHTKSDDIHWDVNFFSKQESEDVTKLVRRLDDICSTAQEKEVRLMVDAEQSYFQSTIDLVATELSMKYNTTETPILFNTYQMYLKESYDKLRNDLIRAKRYGFSFGAKLVRGAYMVSERKRAAELGLPDIIQDTIEDTHHDYNRGVELLLTELAANKEQKTLVKGQATPITFMVASHNVESVSKTCEIMSELGLNPSEGRVLFGQLMGMQDHTTYALGRHGYSAYKYIPYGPVAEVMPYLIRRAQENSAVLTGVTREQDLLIAEIKSRLFGASAPNVTPSTA
ncbi:FAD-linked oxidoreductase [Conidiobolus coronatus NRRL 28638]|uniref:Proline dehydrogenase n=1 Tax=Conidiobolus coronatus (strain ATCC 28846 / CBS 209.66 / NRRL 28638) TaxID=796925 RepID=A0A137PJ88_CONC2|nr:FAD-linked oxidoreductase [Conidiobolus coronatus NRRL 28638]|eukprot:KXN75049.1 FAD-linked oxidoreductase [Conidiobolus coronatus NRRL 28638]